MKLNFNSYKETLQGKYYNGYFYKSKWHSLIWIDGEPYKHRVETFVFNNNMETVFMYVNGDTYKIPGGCIDQKKSRIQQAMDECKEEGRLLVKSIKYTGTYIQKYNIVKVYDEYVPLVPVGQIVDVFVAKYDSHYHKHIFEQLKDYELYEDGKFYNIEDIYNILHEGHKKIIDLFIKE
jgi:hypothetical protein